MAQARLLYRGILGPYLRNRGLLTVTVFDGDPKNYYVAEGKLTTRRLASSPAFEKVAVQRIRASISPSAPTAAPTWS